MTENWTTSINYIKNSVITINQSLLDRISTKINLSPTNKLSFDEFQKDILIRHINLLFKNIVSKYL